MHHVKSTLILSALAGLSLSQAAMAADQDKKSPFSGFYILGAGMAPDYEGSENYDFIPFALGSVTYKGYTLSMQGTQLSLNLSQSETIEYGPVLSFDFGRDDDVDNPALASMTEIDAAIEAGAFVSFPRKELLMPYDEFSVDLSLLTDTGDTHEGTLFNAGTSYKYMVNQTLQLGASLSTTYTDSNYTQTYFGVNAADSALSGLPVYEAGAGFKNVSLGINTMFRFSETAGISGIVRYSRLIGDAADSPIVEQGSENQFLFGAGYFHTF